MMHLGPRVTALVDGQLSPPEEERAWAHVHQCAACRTAVEREGWIKRRLATLSLADHEVVPAGLKGALCRPPVPGPGLAPRSGVDPWLPSPRESRARRFGSLAALGAGSAGAAMVGVVALGAAPAGTPLEDRTAPAADLLSTPPVQPRAAGPGGPASARSQPEVTEAVRILVSAFRLGR